MKRWIAENRSAQARERPKIIIAKLSLGHALAVLP